MSDKLITVFGATGQQGGGLIKALIKQDKYKIRAVTRDSNSDQAQALAAQGIEVVAADMNNVASLTPAMKGSYGVFLVTNFWDPSAKVSEHELVKGVVDAAKQNQVQHFIWSSLPNTSVISNGKYAVVHFTNKARANALVKEADFKYHSIVEAPSYFQNFISGMGPQPTGNGNEKAWTLPINPNSKCLHAGDITELGKLALQTLEQPEKAGQGQILALAGGLYSWQELANILNAQGHNIVVNQVPSEIYDTFFPGASEIREMMNYFEEYTYFGPQAEQHLRAAKELIDGEFTSFAAWAKENMSA